MTLEELVTNLDAMNVSEEDWKYLDLVVHLESEERSFYFSVTQVMKTSRKSCLELTSPGLNREVAELEGEDQECGDCYDYLKQINKLEAELRRTKKELIEAWDALNIKEALT